MSQVKVFRSGTVLSTQVPTEHAKELRRRARRAGHTQSAEVRAAIAQYLEGPTNGEGDPVRVASAKREVGTPDASPG